MDNKKLRRALTISLGALFIISGILFFIEDGWSRAGRGSSYRSRSSSSSSRSYRSSGSSRSSSSRSYRSTPVVPVIPYGGGTHSSGTSSGTTATDTTQEKKPASTKDVIIGLIILLALLGIGIFVIYKVFRFFFPKSPEGPPQPMIDLKKPTTYRFDEAVAQSVRQTDPDFDPQRFMEQCVKTAEILQRAWSNGEMAPARNYTSQGLYNRFKIQLDLMIEKEGVKNVLGDFRVHDVMVNTMSMSKVFQTLHVALTCSALDTMVKPYATDPEVRAAINRATRTSWVEVYSFTRKLGVKTNTSRDWLKGECPNCGYVPDNFSQNNKCSACGSIYNSGEYGWVLSEITQLEEWKPQSAEDVPGLAEIEGKNLSMNREVLEDRASYLFWRWMSARINGDSSLLKRDSAEGFSSGISQAEGLTDIAVGAADLESVETTDKDAIARVRILWAAAFKKGEEPYHQENMFTLSMPLSMQTNNGLADHSCPSCGAPLPDSDALNCSYCGNPLPRIVEDWLLAGVEQIDWEQEEAERYQDDDSSW